MLDILFKIPKSKFYPLTLFLICLIQLILSFQGFDVCDDGFVMTFYQQIFNDPSSVEYNFNYYLGGFVGGIWNVLFGSYGVIGFRFLAIIVNTLTFIISYEILKKYINTYYLLIALSMVLFMNDFGFLTFYHNQLTALLSVLSVFCLFRAITNQNILFYLLSGFIIAINSFTRIPNILLFVLITAIPYYYYITNQSLKKCLKFTAIFIVGASLGFVCVYLLLFFNNGHLEVMQRALFSLKDLGSASDNIHDFNHLISVIINGNIKVFNIIFALIGLGILFVFLSIKKIMTRNIKIFFLIFMFLYFSISFLNSTTYILYAMGYLGILYIVFFNDNIQFKLTAVLAGLTQIVIPIGSGGGISSCGYIAIWLSFPLFFMFITENTTVPKSSLIKKSNFKVMFSLLIVSFFIVKVFRISKEAYFDKGSRLQKTYSIDNTLTKYIYTKKERAQIINEIVFNTKKYVKPNDYLLVYDSFPMIHYLTQTRPYMYNPWVQIYDSALFENKLKQARNEIKKLPIIVQQKFETIFYFHQPDPNFMNENNNNTGYYNRNRTKAMNLFIKENNYEIVWSNSHFNIYKPKDF